MIASNVKGEGLVEVTQLEKYSPYWITADGRLYEKNNFGSFTQIDKKFERFQDKGYPKTRLHSGFGELIKSEQEKATKLFDSSMLESKDKGYHSHDFSKTEKINYVQKAMSLQEKIAKRILENMNIRLIQNH